MYHRDQHMFVLRDPEKPCPDRDLAVQIEGVSYSCIDGARELLGGPIRGVNLLPPEIGLVGRNDKLPGDTVDLGKDRPQTLVPGCHISQGQAERIDVQSGDSVHHRHVVNRRGAVQLVQEPQPLLGIRQRHHFWPTHGGQWGSSARIHNDSRLELRHSRCVEYRSDRQITGEGGVDGIDQPYG